MNNTTKIEILSYASQPNKNYKYEGDYVEYKGKLYFVSLAEERELSLEVCQEVDEND